MDNRRLLSEMLGTFALAFVVWESVAFAMPIAAPLAAALAVGLGVYTLGHVSGAHFNPAVTLGLLSINKMKFMDAMMYIVSQFLGAALAMTLGKLLHGESVVISYGSDVATGIVEALGAFFLLLGIGSVVWKSVHPAASGLVIGASLLFGITIASPFSNAVLNPAVALAIGSFGPMYILGPVIGAIMGSWTYTFLMGKQ